MRIIDKQHDFYDYLQDPTDTIVFDRRGSFLLTKEMIIEKIEDKYRYIWDKEDERYLLLQCGVMYWLIEATLNKSCTDYTLKLICKIKNYNKQRVLIKLTCIRAPYSLLKILKSNKKQDTIDYSSYINGIDKYDELCTLSYNKKYTDFKKSYKIEEQTIPILKPSGIGNIIDPIDIFTAIEEYFSMEKTESERTEPIGATNNDKIIMHGFDTKTSFRGKNK